MIPDSKRNSTRPFIYTIILGLLLMWDGCENQYPQTSVMDQGAITRFDTTQEAIYLAFTGHEFAEGGDHVREVLQRQDIGASFFFTGDFYRNPEFEDLINGLVADGHYGRLPRAYGPPGHCGQPLGQWGVGITHPNP